MAFLQHHELKITTLSPVHIGCNETYEPTNYVIEDGALFEFSPTEALKVLDEADRKKLDNIVSGKPTSEMLKKVQAYFYQRRKDLFAVSSHFLPVGKGIEALYESRIGKTAQRESHDSEVLNRLGIERTSYNSNDRKPIFPGSSIKGAIRTALLDSINQGNSLAVKYKDSGSRDGLNIAYQASKKLEAELLEGKFATDPLRLLSIGDALWQQDDLPASEIYFALNRRKSHSKKEGRLLESMAEQRGLYQLLECVSALRYRSLSTSVTIHNVDTAKPAVGKLPVDKFQWEITDIAAACNRFYLPIFEKEMSLLKQLGYADPKWLENIQRIHELIKDNKAFLLRLGRHSGAESVTLNGVRAIKIMKGKGNKPSFEKAAKTIWLAASENRAQQGMASFGWVLVEIDPKDDNEFCAALTAAVEPMKAWQNAFREKQQLQRLEIEKQELVRLKRQQQEAEQAALEAEQQQQAKAALEEAKQSMSALAGEYFELTQANYWQTDKNAFWAQGVIEEWLDKLEANNEPDLRAQMKKLMEKHFKGALADPEKVGGKKNKPVYKPRVQAVAKRLNILDEA
ncbi:MAG: CRISPR-associated protein, Csm5 family [uncultured Thiotrichaceae bacterium]|uniref:CRISPR system Cms protein Csm5 n=1 Tax=uncultured Thiotrichaceae bacterium TaxID=298394 RepID=A0A6S6TM69_9GAMM|nr:MAG: CRISPR-associated protein, Csm5 family [uncultured Thiotrichaceae bacterium]